MASRRCARISGNQSSLDRVGQSLLLIIGLIISCGLLVSADSTHSLSWAAWFGLLPLFITIRYASPRVALFYGALWGSCFYLFLAATDGGAVSATIRSMGFLAAVPAIYAYLGARLTRRIGYAPLVLAAGWIIVELALEPLALRQGLLAGTQADGGLMRVGGGILGYVFVAFLIAFVNAKILSLVENLRISRVGFLSTGDMYTSRCGRVIRSTSAGHLSESITGSPPRAPPLREANLRFNAP